MTQTHDIVGRGNRDGAALFQKWFTELNHTSEIGGQAAYVFVMGSMAELLRAFDLHLVFPEINSLQTAVRRAVLEPACSGVLLLFDADDDCPKELAQELETWAQEAAGDKASAVVIASREYEALSLIHI